MATARFSDLPPDMRAEVWTLFRKQQGHERLRETTWDPALASTCPWLAREVDLAGHAVATLVPETWAFEQKGEVCFWRGPERVVVVVSRIDTDDSPRARVSDQISRSRAPWELIGEYPCLHPTGGDVVAYAEHDSTHPSHPTHHVRVASWGRGALLVAQLFTTGPPLAQPAGDFERFWRSLRRG